MSKLLRIKLSQAVSGVGGESELLVYFGDRCKLEGMFASGWVKIPASLVPQAGVLVMPGIVADVEASNMILSVSEI